MIGVSMLGVLVGVPEVLVRVPLGLPDPLHIDTSRTTTSNSAPRMIARRRQ
jgi:hypothetical protein